MSFFFNDFFGGGMPGGGGHHHFHGMGGDDSDDEPVDTETFYKLLGIEKNATQDEIKKAYRKKAKSLHPDRHPGEHEKYQSLFQEVQAANEVLKDPQKRSLYDKYGEKGVKRGGGSRSGGSSIFEQMFGGQSPGQSADHGPKKSPTIKTALDVTLQDIYCGTTKKIKIQRRVAGSDSKQCPRCHGQGQITQVQRMGPMVLQQRRECPSCGGIGYKLVRESHEIEIHVPVGGRHGENITIQGEGNKYPDMGIGDVILQIRISKHNLFKRQGADLGMNYSLSLRQALCGYKIKIPHVSGKMLCITQYDQNEIVQPGSLKVIHTMGLPQRFSAHTKGHLYIVMDVKMPIYDTLSNGQFILNQFEKILPQQQDVLNIDNDQEDDEEEDDEKESKQNNTSTNTNTSNNNKPKNQNKKKQQQQTKKKQPKNKQFKNKKNNKKNNRKKNGKNNKKKGGGSGVFSGLQGHFGGDNKNKNNKNNNNNNNDKMDEDEDDDEMIEEVECHSVDGNPKATPASASNYYNDDDDDGDGVQCRQM